MQRPEDESERRSEHGERCDLQPVSPDEATTSPQRLERGATLELDRGGGKRPADRQPDRNRDEHNRAHEKRNRRDGDADRTEERSRAVEREPVGPERADRPPVVDLQERAGRWRR